jgi:hypothetical protein
MKKCSQCKIEKAFTDFYKRKNTIDGLRTNCKKCFESGRNKSKRKAQTKYSKTEKGKLTEKKHSPKRELRAKYLGHRAATDKVRRAIKCGFIKKIPCEVCGSLEVQAHHEDYSKPLEVIWLCAFHHMKLHYEKRILQNEYLGTEA